MCVPDMTVGVFTTHAAVSKHRGLMLILITVVIKRNYNNMTAIKHTDGLRNCTE